MFMDPTDAKKYPKCTKFMSTIESTLKKQPTVLKAFLDACKADDQTLPARDVEKIARERALRWGAGPRVTVTEGIFDAPSGGEVVKACGFMNGIGNALNKKNPLFIQITSFWFDAFEFGYDPARAGNRLTRTLLHELVHWVRDATKASNLILVGGGYKGEYKEAGHVFEENAYGRTNICNDDEIFDALTSFRIRPS
jgi:zincin-like metallopeptidase toxin 3 of polymorphic toxin system